MPRIESNATRSSSGGSGFQFPMKALVLFGLIACAIGYAVYQYVHLNPTPRRANPAAGTVALNKPKDSVETRKTAYAKLNLTSDQSAKMDALIKETTSPQALRKEMAKVLTPDQKKEARQLSNESKKNADSKKQERKAKQERMMKGVSPAYLEKAQAELKVRREAAKASNTSAVK